MSANLDAVLTDLAATIAARAKEPASSSYTAKLVGRGVRHVAKKFGEESVEAVVAAVAGDRENLREEAADVLYHLLVMLHVSGVSPQEVADTLRGRETRSGLEEKASRRPD